MHEIPVRTLRRRPGWAGMAALGWLIWLAGGWAAHAAELAGTQQIIESGRLRTFEVALTEISVKAPNSGPRLQAVSGLATAEAVRIHAELVGQTTGQETELVLYEAGKPRDQFTRRVLTRQVLAHLAPGMDPAVLSAFTGGIAKGGLPYAPSLHIFEARSVGGALALAIALQGQPGVHSAEPLLARQYAKFLVPNDPLFTNEWHLLNTGQNGASLGVDINVTNVWDTFRGAGVTIGIVDDSLQGSHPDLTNNYNFSLGLDVNDGDLDPSPNVLADFHGTAVAGVAAARGNNNLGVAGVAFEATLAGIRFLGGPATDIQVAQCLTHSNQVIQVYNNSWGVPTFTDLFPLPTVISNALVQGVQSGRGGRGSIFVFAAGNSGLVGDNANYSGLVNSLYTIGVGALNDRFDRASYGNPGAALVISAPAGNDGIRPQGTSTTDLVGTAGYNSGTPTDPLEYAGIPDYTSRFNGTSSASPVVAGVVALMLQANPNLGWRDVQEILIRSATLNRPTHPDWSTNAAGFHFNHDFGAGLVNAGGAVGLAVNWTNLGPQFSYVAQQGNLALPIPDNNTNGAIFTFDVTNANVRIEHVTLGVNITHPWRGDIAVELTSPSGIVSRMAEAHINDSNPNYQDWTFMSVRNWGELAEGTWTVRVSDRIPVLVGTLNSLELRCHGSFTNSSGQATNPPTITAQPRSRTVTQGSTVNFSVGIATNVTQPLRYQWRYNGSDILGAVNPVLTLTNAQASAGGLYSVLVANPIQTNFSAEAGLFVNAPPVVFANPQNQSVIIGSNVTFIVAASGSAPFTYQWRRNGAPISGAVSQTYTITNAQTSQAGSYDVLVANALASVFSSNAALTVLPPFTISPQPLSMSTNVGGNATFTVGAVGLGAFTGPFTYQWTLGGAALAGETNTSLALTSLGLGSSGNYACVVGSPLGNLTSSNGVLTVFNPFTVGSATFQLGGLFQLTATGDNGRSYRLESSTNLVNWVPVVTNVVSGGAATFTDSGATSQTLRFYRIVLLP